MTGGHRLVWVLGVTCDPPPVDHPCLGVTADPPQSWPNRTPSIRHKPLGLCGSQPRSDHQTWSSSWGVQMMGDGYPPSDSTSPILPRKHWRSKATASGTRRSTSDIRQSCKRLSWCGPQSLITQSDVIFILTLVTKLRLGNACPRSSASLSDTGLPLSMSGLDSVGKCRAVCERGGSGTRAKQSFGDRRSQAGAWDRGKTLQDLGYPIDQLPRCAPG